MGAPRPAPLKIGRPNQGACRATAEQGANQMIDAATGLRWARGFDWSRGFFSNAASLAGF